tara:strand:- start:357 stop:572 length:216 start_codon:yes stop_codon:yes gene_type:complete
MKYVIARNCSEENCEHLAIVSDEEGEDMIFKSKKDAKEFKDMLVKDELLAICEKETARLQEEIMIMPKEEN